MTAANGTSGVVRAVAIGVLIALIAGGVAWTIRDQVSMAQWRGSMSEIVEKVGPDVASLRIEISALRHELFRQSDWERERRVIDAQLGRIEDKVDALKTAVDDINGKREMK